MVSDWLALRRHYRQRIYHCRWHFIRYRAPHLPRAQRYSGGLIMYDRDMPLMRAHALASPSGFVDVVAFVLSTIQQPLQSVGNQMAEIRAHGAASKYLFGSKRPGLTYAMAHAAALHAAVTAAVDASDTIGAIDIISTIPG